MRETLQPASSDASGPRNSCVQGWVGFFLFFASVERKACQTITRSLISLPPCQVYPQGRIHRRVARTLRSWRASHALTAYFRTTEGVARMSSGGLVWHEYNGVVHNREKGLELQFFLCGGGTWTCPFPFQDEDDQLLVSMNGTNLPHDSQ